MKTSFSKLLIFITILQIIISTDAKKQRKQNQDKFSSQSQSCAASVAVTNRDSQNFYILNAKSGKRSRTVKMPGDAKNQVATPMYTLSVNDYLYVTDGYYNWIAVFLQPKYFFVKVMPAAPGLTKIAADARGEKLWALSDDIITIYDLSAQVPIKTLSLSLGTNETLNDIVLSPDGSYAFVTTNDPTASGSILKYDTSTYELVQQNSGVGVDANAQLAISPLFNYLFLSESSPSDTETGLVHVIYQDDLLAAAVPAFAVPGAHDMVIAPFSTVLYVTDIIGDTYGVTAIDIENLILLGSTTEVAVKDDATTRIAFTGSKLYVTHSTSTSSVLSVYDATNGNPVPVYDSKIKVGRYPFDVTYIEAEGCVPDAITG